MWQQFGKTLAFEAHRFVTAKSTVIYALCYYVIVNGLDIFTSIIPMPVGVEEQNVFMRDSMHHFILVRGIEVKIIFTLAALIFGATLYGMFRKYNERFAQFCFSLPFIYIATSLLFHAVITNVLISQGWFQP